MPNTDVDPPRWSHGRFIGLRDDPAASAIMVSSWSLLSLAAWQLGRIVAGLDLEDAVFEPLADSEIGGWLAVALLCLASAFSHRWARNRQESVGAQPSHLWLSQHRPPDGRERAPEGRLALLPAFVASFIAAFGTSVTFEFMLDDTELIDADRGQLVSTLVLTLIPALAAAVALCGLWMRRRIASRLPTDHPAEFATNISAAAAHGFAVLSALVAVWVAGRTGVPSTAGIGSTLNQMRLSMLLLMLAGLGAFAAATIRLGVVARRQAMAAASAPAPSASAAS